MSKTLRWLYAARIRDGLGAIQNRMVGIRKMLRTTQQKTSPGRGVMDDAVQLAETIERLCSLGQTAAAEDAFEIAERVEVLVSLLEAEIDAF
jgi:hypothetical protein